MKTIRVVLFGMALIACTTLGGCIAGMNGWSSSAGLTDADVGLAYSSFPADGDLGVPIDVGMAALLLSEEFELSVSAGGMALYDDGASASIAVKDLLADVLVDASAADSRTTPLVRERGSYVHPRDGKRNVAGVMMPGGELVSGEGPWDVTSTSFIDDGRTYRFVVPAGTTGTASGVEFEVASDIPITFATPKLYRYVYQGSTERGLADISLPEGLSPLAAPAPRESAYYSRVVAIPDSGWVIAIGHGVIYSANPDASISAAKACAGGCGADNKLAVFLHAFDRRGQRLDDMDTNRAASASVIWSDDINALLNEPDEGLGENDAMNVVGMEYQNGVLYVAGSFHGGLEGPTSDPRGYWYATFTVGSPASGFALARTSLTVVDETDALVATILEQEYGTANNRIQGHMALDSHGNMYLVGYEMVVNAIPDVIRAKVIKIPADGGARSSALYDGGTTFRNYFAAIFIDEEDRIYLGGVESGAGPTFSLVLMRGDESIVSGGMLNPIAWSKSLIPMTEEGPTGELDVMLDLIVDGDLTYGAGYRYITADEQIDAEVLVYDIAELNNSSGLVAWPETVASLTRRVGDMNLFYSLTHTTDRYSGETTLYAAGYLGLGSSDDHRNDRNMVIEKFTFDQESNTLTSRRMATDSTDTEIPDAMAEDITLDSDGALVVVGSDNVGSYLRHGDLYVRQGVIWRVDRNVNLKTEAP